METVDIRTPGYVQGIRRVNSTEIFRFGPIRSARMLGTLIAVLLIAVGPVRAEQSSPPKAAFFFGGGMGGCLEGQGSRPSVNGITIRRHAGLSLRNGDAVMLEYEVHRTGQERLAADPGEAWPGQPVSSALKSTFVFVSYRKNIYGGFFVRPELGFSYRKRQTPRVAAGFGLESAMDTLRSSLAPAFGASLGYAFDITPRYSLALEYVYRQCLKADGLGPISAFNFQITFSRRF